MRSIEILRWLVGIAISAFLAGLGVNAYLDQKIRDLWPPHPPIVSEWRHAETSGMKLCLLAQQDYWSNTFPVPQRWTSAQCEAIKATHGGSHIYYGCETNGEIVWASQAADKKLTCGWN